MFEKISKLLALAENASTEAEAEAAFAKAQELASRHAIDLELTRRAAAPKQRETPVDRIIRIGKKGQRANKPLINLFLGIGASNDLKVYIAHNSTFVHAFGMPSDLDVAEALWASLATTMVKFGNAHVNDKNAAWRSETVMVWDDRTWEEVEKKVTGQGARRSFYDSYTGRIGERLREARRESVAAAQAEADGRFHGGDAAALEGGSPNTPVGMSLVLKEKKAEVDQYALDDYKRRYGRAPRGSWNGGSSATRSASSAAAGRAAADRTSLSSRRGIAS